jgi:hypothetical protein
VTPPPPPTLTSITVLPANASIYVGRTLQYVAVGHYSDGSVRNITSTVTWASSVSAVAPIAAGGLATGATVGGTTISASLSGIQGSTPLNVIPLPPPPTLLSISVTPVNVTINVGQSEQYAATGHYSDGSTRSLTSAVTWSSSQTSVATIGAGGLASSTAAGATTIGATLGTLYGSTTLTVITTPPPPPPPVCPGGDVSYLLEFNFAGGAFNNPVFNYNGSNSVDSSIIPANGVLLGGVYASAPVFNTYTAGINGNGGEVALITLGDGTISSFYQLGLHQQRYSWREIR